jgi:hypothetical protein
MAVTKADETSKNNIFSDNTTTKMSYLNTMGKVSSTITISTSSSPQIRMPKSINTLASSILYTRTNNSNKKSTYSTPVGNSNSSESTTPPLLPIQTSSSGWPLLKDVITQRNSNSREPYKPNSLIKANKKLNAKSRKRLKRRRRILDRKNGHNRTARKLTKQKLKIKSRMKNNSIVHQKSQKKRGKNLQSNLFNSHVGSTTSNQTSGSSLAPKSNNNIVVPSPSSSTSRYKRRKVEKVKTKKRFFKNQETTKSQNTTSLNSYQTTVINQALTQSNDSMLADEAPHILSGLEPEVSMMDYAWNEDKIEIDFKTGKKRYNMP